MLLAMFLFFLGVVAWVFRPGSRETYKDTADIPFRHEDKPAGDGDMTKMVPGAHLKEARQ
jgi:cytochrome c oxidase cbb3-type subunit 4